MLSGQSGTLESNVSMEVLNVNQLGVLKQIPVKSRGLRAKFPSDCELRSDRKSLKIPSRYYQMISAVFWKKVFLRPLTLEDCGS